MARLTVSWTAECDHCNAKLGEARMDDSCPDRNDFNTTTCEYCGEEVCGDCADSDYDDMHPECKKILDEEDAEEKTKQ